jgi:hypothetical protein
MMIKIKAGVSKKAGEPIYEHEVDWSDILRLPEEYNDCGYMILWYFGDKVLFSFDLRYNMATCRNMNTTARRFQEIALYALSKKYWSPFIDNLFSAAELAAKSIVLTSLETDRKKLENHNLVQDRFTKFADWGNVDKDLKSAFHRLRDQRVPARYLKGRDSMYTIDEKEAQSLYDRVELLILQAEKMVE